VQADRDGAHRERQADHDMPQQQSGEADVFAQARVLEKLQKADPGDQRREHQRTERQGDDRLAALEAIAGERKGERQREGGADQRGEASELQAEPQRIDPFGRQRALPPLQREAARREL
jgi:hypothetical protein